MKRYYRIGEIAALYDIGTDSLRYYEEIGLLEPHRGENGYRSYSINDIWRLNIIRDMLRLDFSTRQIKTYLDDHTVDTTLDLLNKEKKVIDKEIAELVEIKRDLVLHEGEIRRARELPLEKFELLVLAERRASSIGVSDLRLEGNFDVMIKRLHNREGGDRALISRDTGAFLSLAEVKRGVFDRYSSVFMLRGENEEYDLKIPQGEFAVVRYTGPYSGTTELMPRLLEHAESLGRIPCGNPIELYLIDIYETENEDEFLTELQIPVRTPENS